jgi:hypothetical protein
MAPAIITGVVAPVSVFGRAARNQAFSEFGFISILSARYKKNQYRSASNQTQIRKKHLQFDKTADYLPITTKYMPNKKPHTS